MLSQWDRSLNPVASLPLCQSLELAVWAQFAWLLEADSPQCRKIWCIIAHTACAAAHADIYISLVQEGCDLVQDAVFFVVRRCLGGTGLLDISERASSHQIVFAVAKVARLEHDFGRSFSNPLLLFLGLLLLLALLKLLNLLCDPVELALVVRAHLV